MKAAQIGLHSWHRLNLLQCEGLIKKTDLCTAVAVFPRHAAVEFSKSWTGLHIRPLVKHSRKYSVVRAVCIMSQYSQFLYQNLTLNGYLAQFQLAVALSSIN